MFAVTDRTGADLTTVGGLPALREIELLPVPHKTYPTAGATRDADTAADPTDGDLRPYPPPRRPGRLALKGGAMMRHNRIAVGYDGSPAARYALAWAVREAMGRDAIVLLVTAWPATAHTSHDPATLVAHRLRLHGMQRRGVAEAVAGLDRPPVVAREIILADPVTALVHAASFADIVVIGGDATEALRPGSVAAVLAERLGRRRRQRADPAPVVVLTTTSQAAALPAAATAPTSWPPSDGRTRVPAAA